MLKRTVLALVGEGLKKDSPLAKTCAKTGELLFFDVPRSKLPSWVAERFRALAATADRDACQLLVEIVLAPSRRRLRVCHRLREAASRAQ